MVLVLAVLILGGAAALLFGIGDLVVAVPNLHKFDCEAVAPPCSIDHSQDWFFWALGIGGVVLGAAMLALVVWISRRHDRGTSTD